MSGTRHKKSSNPHLCAEREIVWGEEKAKQIHVSIVVTYFFFQFQIRLQSLSPGSSSVCVAGEREQAPSLSFHPHFYFYLFPWMMEIRAIKRRQRDYKIQFFFFSTLHHPTASSSSPHRSILIQVRKTTGGGGRNKNTSKTRDDFVKKIEKTPGDSFLPVLGLPLSLFLSVPWPRNNLHHRISAQNTEETTTSLRQHTLKRGKLCVFLYEIIEMAQRPFQHPMCLE